MRLVLVLLILPACQPEAPLDPQPVSRALKPECRQVAERVDPDGDGAWNQEIQRHWDDGREIGRELYGSDGQLLGGSDTEWDGPNRRARDVQWWGPQQQEVTETHWSWIPGPDDGWTFVEEVHHRGQLEKRSWGTLTADLRLTRSVQDQDLDGVPESWLEQVSDRNLGDEPEPCCRTAR